MDGFNAVQKQYLATCLLMRNTPEVDNIYNTCMHVDDMTEKGEVSFAVECKCYWIFIMKLVPRVIKTCKM